MGELNPDKILHNISSDIVITTDADELIELIQNKKEISMSDAAKHLKVGLSTVEAWAGFLEEENLLAIKYKLTTPYLTEYHQDTKKESSKSEKTNLYSVNEVDESFEENKKEEQPKEEEHYGSKKLIEKVVKRAVDPGLRPIQIRGEMTKDLNKLLEKAYEFIEKGDFKSAEKVYSLIHQNYDELPSDFQKMRQELDKNLTKLNKDLAINLSKSSSKQARLISKLISSEIRNMKFALSRKDIKKAETSFENAENLYMKFPDGFVIKKTELQNEMLDSYKVLIRNKHKIISKFIDIKNQQIDEIIKVIKESMAQDDIGKAFEKYDELKVVYNQIPGGYLQDRPELENKIVKILPELVNKKHEYSSRKIIEETKKIKSLMASTRQFMNSNKINETNKEYLKLKALYDNLPAGYIEEKIDLEEQILKLHQELTEKLNKDYVLLMEQGTKKINLLLKKAKQHLSGSEPILAEGVHREIEHHYKSLPEGFIQQKTALKIQMLDIYREMLLKSDESKLKEFDESADKKYKQLLQLVVSSHQHIQESNFELLISDNDKISNLYGHLPFSLVKQETKLGQEVSKIQELSDLYKLAKQLDQVRSNPSEFNLLSQQADVKYKKLISHCLGCDNLFRFVRQQIDGKELQPLVQKHQVQPIQTSPPIQTQPIKPPMQEAPKPTPLNKIKPITQSRSQPFIPRSSTPDNVQNLIKKAETDIKKEEIDTAKKTYEKVLEKDATQPIAKSRLSMIEKEKGLGDAKNIFEKSIENVKKLPVKPEVNRPVKEIHDIIIPLKSVKEDKSSEVSEAKASEHDQISEGKKIPSDDVQKQDISVSDKPEVSDIQPKSKQPKPFEPKSIKDITSKNIDTIYSDAKRYYDQKDYFNAIRLFREVKKQDSNYKDLQMLLKDALKQKDRSELKSMLEKVRNNKPRDRILSKVRIPKFIKKQDDKDMAPELEKTTPKVTTKSRRDERISMLTQVKLKDAQDLISHNKMKDARLVLDSILKMNPDCAEAKSLLDNLGTNNNMKKKEIVLNA